MRQLHFEEAIPLKLDIQEWTDIQKKFAKDDSRETMEKAYHIMNGCFERYDMVHDVSWSQVLENLALDHSKFAYEIEEPERKHGFRRKLGGKEIITKGRRKECSKLIDIKSRKTHDEKVNIKEFVDVNGKQKKKKRVTFMMTM